MFSWTVQELGHAGDVEAGPRVVERLHDGRVAVGLDRVIDLHARQVLAELRVVLAQHFVVHHDKRRAVRLGQAKQRLLIHGFSARVNHGHSSTSCRLANAGITVAGASAGTRVLRHLGSIPCPNLLP